jgi:hypothetical protein
VSEPTVPARDLDSELRRYFAVTTSAELPRRVRELSARTLGVRRRPGVGLLAGAGGALATAALLVLVATHAGHGGTSSAVSSAPGAGVGPSSALGQFEPALIIYPGVDTTRLALNGTRLVVPAGHGIAGVSSSQAEAAAITATGAKQLARSPAVLAFAVFGKAPARSCLCWVVQVPLPAGPYEGSVNPSPLHSELVLVDAVTGRVTAVLTGNGIP